MLSNMLFGFLAARILSKTDYATFRQTFLISDFFLPIIVIGIPNAISYLFVKEFKNPKGLLIDVLSILFSGVILTSLIIILGGANLIAEKFNNIELNKTIPLLIIYFFSTIPLSIISAVLVFTNHVKKLAFFNLLSNSVVTILTIISLTYFKNIQNIILVRVLLTFLFLPYGIYLMVNSVKGEIRFPNFRYIKYIIKYCMPIGLATMIGTITVQLHSLIVASLCTPSDFAIYINGAFEVPFIGIITGSVTSIVLVELTNACSKENKEKAIEIFKYISFKSSCLLFPVMVFFFISAKEFITILYSENYISSVLPFRLYLILMPARIITYGAALMALGLSNQLFFRSIIDFVLNASLCYLFVKYFGYPGAALSLSITLYFWTIPYNIYLISRGFSTKWVNLFYWSKLLKIFLISILAAFLPYIVLNLLNPINIYIAFLSSFILYSFIVIIGFQLIKIFNFRKFLLYE